MFSRAHIYIRGLRGLPVTLFGLVICAIISVVVITSVPAQAIENPLTTLEKGARGWYALRFIRDHNRADGSPISPEDVDKMFYVPEPGLDRSCFEKNAGYLLEPTKGVMARDSGMLCIAGGDTTADNAFNAAFQAIGYDRTTFIVAMGYSKQASGMYEGGDITDARLNSALSNAKVSADLTGSKLGMPSIGNEPAAWMQYFDLVAGIEKGACLKAGLREFPDPAGNISLVETDGSGGLVVKKYKVEAQSKSVKVAVGAEISCAQAVERLGDGDGGKARSLVAAYNSLVAAAPKTCEQMYFGEATDANLNACIDGFNNKTTPGYCSKYGPGTPTYNACVAGQSASGTTGVTPIDAPAPAAVPGEKTQTCGISSIGWIVCPVMTFLADINDKAYGFIAENFLSMDATKYFSDSNTKVAWEVFRNYSNVIFIIMFLIIVYSQVTSAGISNYGIKKMLPRLLIVAILVNISYYICVLAVDVSNILGYGVQEMFAAIIPEASSGGTGGVIKGFDGSPLLWGGIIAGAIAGTAMTIGLAASVPVLLSALVALAMILLILVGRKAIIILLVVISPLAFAASLLPNTESLYKKWWKMFSSLLLLFPVIAAVFGGSRLAASILASIDGNLETQVAALAASVIPFFVVPSLLKGALAATGSLGAKLQGAANKATGNVSSRARSGAKSTFDRRTAPIQDAWKYRKQQREIRRARKIGEGTLRRGALGVVGGGGYSSKLATQAAALEDKEYEEGVSAAKSSFAGKTFEDINNLALDPSASEHVRTAAVRHVMEKGNFSQRRALVEASSGMSSAQKSAVVNGVMSRGDQAVYGAKVGDAIVRGEVNGSNIENYVAQNIADGKIKAETMVLDADATKLIADVSTGGRTYDIKDSAGVTTTRGISATERASVRTAAADAETLSSTSSKVSENFRAQFRRL